MAKKAKLSWGQPVCAECWAGMTVKIGRPADKELRGVKNAHCCYCKKETSAGKAFIQRVNPNAVPYPTLAKDDE